MPRRKSRPVARLLAAAATFFIVKARALSRRDSDLVARDLEIARLLEVVALLQARIAGVPPPNRPRFAPWQRLRVLTHQVMHGLSIEQTSKTFAVTATTVRRWWKHARDGKENLVRTVRRMSTKSRLIEELTCILRLALPLAMGTRTLAGHLHRLGIAVSRSTVQRILKRKPRPPDEPAVLQNFVRKCAGIKAKYFGHVVILDFSRAPRCVGAEDLWIGGVIDVFTRAIVATLTCVSQPTAKFATRLLDLAIANIGRAPKHSISDKGVQFRSKRFRKWLRRHGIKHRYGALGRHGSIAILERWWRTAKGSIPWTWCIFATPAALGRHVDSFVRWYNAERPHTFLHGDSPDDVRAGRRRRERDIPATGKWKLTVSWTGPTRDLPIVRLRKVA